MSPAELLATGFAVGFGAWATLSGVTRLISEWKAQNLHPCRNGHDYSVDAGGRNAGCSLDRDCVCSVPVYRCSRCHDFDYGDNQEARDIIARCAENGPVW